jgi:hypothetical protein
MTHNNNYQSSKINLIIMLKKIKLLLQITNFRFFYFQCVIVNSKKYCLPTLTIIFTLPISQTANVIWFIFYC